MKKLVLFSIFGLLQCHISYCMLIKQVHRAPKYIKTIRTKKMNEIHNILKDNPLKDNNEIFSQEEFGSVGQLKDFYFRNQRIINILIDEQEKDGCAMAILRLQQQSMVKGFADSIDYIRQLEKQLYISLKIKKDNE